MSICSVQDIILNIMKKTKESINHGAYCKLGEETRKIHSKCIKRGGRYLNNIPKQKHKGHLAKALTNAIMQTTTVFVDKSHFIL